MSNKNLLRLAVPALLGLAALTGCNSSRDVELSGTVSTSANTILSGEIRVDFVDPTISDAAAATVHSIAMSKPGPFSETVAISGDSIVVRALNDRDGNGACSPGEAWAEVTLQVPEGKSPDPISLALSNAPCPSP